MESRVYWDAELIANVPKAIYSQVYSFMLKIRANYSKLVKYFHCLTFILSHFSCKAILTLLLCKCVPYSGLNLSVTNILYSSCHTCIKSIHSSSIVCHLTFVYVIHYFVKVLYDH